jgi:hypothetical protein
MYTNEELGYILYNNRSVKGVVSNFLPELNPVTLVRIENQLKECKSIWQDDNRMVEVNSKELNTKAEDVIITKEDLYSLTEIVRENCGLLSADEYNYLENRGLGEKTILDWDIVGLSAFNDKRHLEILGATIHPILSPILQDAIEQGGILIPLFDENDRLINCAIRKIGIESNGFTRTLKYSLACPDISVWGLDRFGQDKEIWITEGIFDTMALVNLGKNAITCSSAMWSGIQLYQVIKKKPSSIVIFSDKDEVGLRSSAILKDFFELNNIKTKTVISKVAKDPAEHYFQKNQYLDDILEININKEILNTYQDNSFDFLNYLKNRKIS